MVSLPGSQSMAAANPRRVTPCASGSVPRPWSSTVAVAAPVSCMMALSPRAR